MTGIGFLSEMAVARAGGLGICALGEEQEWAMPPNYRRVMMV